MPSPPPDPSRLETVPARRGAPGLATGRRDRAAAIRRWATSVLALGLVMMGTAAVWGMVRPNGAPVRSVTTVAVGITPTPEPSPTLRPSPTPEPSPALRPSPTPEPSPASTVAASELDETDDTVPATGTARVTAADREAGLRSTVVPTAGKRSTVVVPGEQKAPGTGRVRQVRVEVESGLDVDGAAFAGFVLATLNDRRGWGHGATVTFARTSGKADIRVVLASPQTSAAMCRPLVTRGTVSCATGSTAVLTVYRWVRGTPDYGTDLTGYRQYLVNHEVGHVLGHQHQGCPGTGKRAPVMLQQTKGLQGCLKNPWPYP